MADDVISRYVRPAVIQFSPLSYPSLTSIFVPDMATNGEVCRNEDCVSADTKDCSGTPDVDGDSKDGLRKYVGASDLCMTIIYPKL